MLIFFNEKDIDMTLYEKVTFLREKLGISQSEFERRAGLSKGTVTNWKVRKPNMTSLEKAASALGCDVRYLLSEGEVSSEDSISSDNSELISKIRDDAYLMQMIRKIQELDNDHDKEILMALIDTMLNKPRE